jgi:glycosyltransferase involved in cell wall biosynthesis
MKIAMIGQKGMVLGERGGGIERHVAEISTYLVESGHDVTVYARAKYAPEKPERLRGVHLKFIPTIYSKNLEAIIHTFFSTLHALFQGYDIIHYHGVGPATLSWIPRIFVRKAKTIVTFHSQDQFHQKWSFFARKYLAFGERAAATFPHYCISVSHVIQVYCRDHFNREVVYIPNGATPKDIKEFDELEKFGLEVGGYILNEGSDWSLLDLLASRMNTKRMCERSQRATPIFSFWAIRVVPPWNNYLLMLIFTCRHRKAKVFRW